MRLTTSLTCAAAVALAAACSHSGSADTDPGGDQIPPGGDPAPPVGGTSVWVPSPGTTWQWQLAGALDTSVDVAVYDVDLFETSATSIAALHASGRKVICYLSAGTREPNRPDTADFPAAAVGNALPDWPDENWLDTRSSTVRDLIAKRFDLALAKGCDAVEPDNVDAYANNPGFPLTAATQLDFNRFLASAAHTRGLSVGLKNDLDQIPDLVAAFDWCLDEECWTYSECASTVPFIEAGKAVFHAEYVAESQLAAVCAVTKPLGLSTILKHLELDTWRRACP